MVCFSSTSTFISIQLPEINNFLILVGIVAKNYFYYMHTSILTSALSYGCLLNRIFSTNKFKYRFQNFQVSNYGFCYKMTGQDFIYNLKLFLRAPKRWISNC